MIRNPVRPVRAARAVFLVFLVFLVRRERTAGVAALARVAGVGVLVAALAFASACGSPAPAAYPQASHSQASHSQASHSQAGDPQASELIPGALLNEARPIGTGPRFQPPVSGSPVGRCQQPLGARTGVHVELFAANRVVLLPAGIGTRPPLTLLSGRIAGARCYGALVTLDPTGLVLTRPGSRLTLADLFRSWGEPLTATRLASFRASPGRRVAVFVGGRPWPGAPGAVPLTPHAEIVLEVGPHVPPHSSYVFPPAT